MNKFYDKLLLVIALIALLAGVGFYVTKSGEVPSGAPQVSTQAADNPYQLVPVIRSIAETVSWPDVEEQSSGWVYDVFTPPQIFLEPDGTFTIIPIVPEEDRPPFGLYLATMRQDPYRIQVEGYIEEKDNSLILFYDEERKQSIRARVGDIVADSGFEVSDFKIERIVDPVEGIYKVATAKILDQREDKEFTLIHGERLMKEEVTIIVKSKEDSSIEIQLMDVGESFETPLGQYTLKEINLEESSITVEKGPIGDFNAETTVLVASTESAETPTSEPTTENPVDNQLFDFGF